MQGRGCIAGENRNLEPSWEISPVMQKCDTKSCMVSNSDTARWWHSGGSQPGLPGLWGSTANCIFVHGFLIHDIWGYQPGKFKTTIPESEGSVFLYLARECRWIPYLSGCSASMKTQKLPWEGKTLNFADIVSHRCGPAPRSREVGGGLPSCLWRTLRSHTAPSNTWNFEACHFPEV